MRHQVNQWASPELADGGVHDGGAAGEAELVLARGAHVPDTTRTRTQMTQGTANDND
jgi:hypothetical protein